MKFDFELKYGNKNIAFYKKTFSNKWRKNTCIEEFSNI